MNPIADLRAAVLSLQHVPDGTPIEPGVVFGAPSLLAYDANTGVVRLNIGAGRPTGRPTMGQLRSWLGLPLALADRVGLGGPWDSARGLEPPTFRGVLTFLSAAASGYHGVVRNGGSVWWGLVWFTMGAVLPGLVPVVAIAQGYGECANNCRVAASERR